MQPDLRKKELVDLAVDRSGVKKRDAKPAIEAALAILGEALEAGRSLQLPPLGRVKVQRSKELDDGQVIVAKVRRKGVSDDDEPSESNSKTDGEGLAKAAE
ncbi:HU family DNA-binding protein [Shimia isoporae]|nr:HU family DNA-binding protein [Shimia isoporae]